MSNLPSVNDKRCADLETYADNILDKIVSGKLPISIQLTLAQALNTECAVFKCMSLVSSSKYVEEFFQLSKSRMDLLTLE